MVLAYAVEFVKSISELRVLAGWNLAGEVLLHPLAVKAFPGDVGVGGKGKAGDGINLLGQLLWGHAYCLFCKVVPLSSLPLRTL